MSTNVKKLLIVTGAGASIEFGMPSVNQIDALMESWALEILPLVAEPAKSLYTWVKETVSQHILSYPNVHSETVLNFENLLYTIQTLASLGDYAHWRYYSNRLMPFITVTTFPQITRYHKEKQADSEDFGLLHTWLVDKLVQYFRELCKSLDRDRPTELKISSEFFNYLGKDFNLGFINLNYDNVIISALPNLSTGYERNTGEFDRGQLYNDNWHFCYHLHGSVHFDMRGGDKVDMHGIRWNNDLQSQFRQNSSGRNKEYTSQGINHLNSTLIMGLDKANQILREPFTSYFMQIDRLIYEADSILFIGYGFNDLHLNKAFPFIRYDKIKKRKVVIVDYASDKEDSLGFRNDSWSHGVFATLPCNGRELGDGKSSMHHPAIHYKRNRILEKSSNSDFPLAIWYNGFLEACQHPDIIRAEL